MGQLETEQYDLVETLAQVQSDDFIETEARTKLNLRKPGENVVIVSSDEDIQKFTDKSGGIGIKDLLDESESNMQRWWELFFPSYE